MLKKNWSPFAGTILGIAGLVFVFQMGFGSSNEPSATVLANNDLQRGTLVVSEVGEVSLAPDMAYIQIGAEAVDSSAEKAQNLVNERVNAVRQVIKDYGIKEEDVKTAYLNVNPDYRHDPNKEERYRAQHMLEIEFKQINKLGEFIDDASAAGANLIQQTRFALQDSQEAEHQALQLAIEKSVTRADIMAKSANRIRGEVLQITDQQAQVNFPMRHYEQNEAAMDAVNNSTVIDEGEVTITQRVDVVYELK